MTPDEVKQYETDGCVRAGYTMRYFTTSSKRIAERNKGHKIWLARGKDRAGNIYENLQEVSSGPLARQTRERLKNPVGT